MNLSRLVSKKLTVTVATVTGLIASRAYVEAAGVAVAYLTAQGVVDARNTTHILGTLDEVVAAVSKKLETKAQAPAADYTAGWFGECSEAPAIGVSVSGPSSPILAQGIYGGATVAR